MFVVLLFALTAIAGQTGFNRAEDGADTDFMVKWKDADSKSQSVRFTLPTRAVKSDLAIGLGFPKKASSAAQVAAEKRYAKTLPKGVKLKAKPDGNGGVRLSVSARSRGDAKDALRGAKEVQEKALDEFLDEHEWTELKKDHIIPDHARLARLYADDVAPVAEALRAGTRSSRDYAARALSFVQSIPYEKRKGGGGKGYRRPVSLLAANKGDCDGKSVLFLALMRAAYPEVDGAMVYIKNHAFVGLALEPEKGELTFRQDGVRYVMADPVGPALSALGDGGKKSKRRVVLGAIQVRAVADG